VRSFLNEHSFVRSRDVLKPSLPNSTAEDADGVAGRGSGVAAHTRSPEALKYMGSLHTGLSPEASLEDKPISRRLFDSPIDRDRGDEVRDADLEECFWQPSGLDRFICETRARRRQLSREESADVSAAPARTRPLGVHTGEMDRAAELLRAEDTRVRRESSRERHEDASSAEGSDEELPVAVVPQI